MNFKLSVNTKNKYLEEISQQTENIPTRVVGIWASYPLCLDEAPDRKGNKKIKKTLGAIRGYTWQEILWLEIKSVQTQPWQQSQSGSDSNIVHIRRRLDTSV